MSGSGGGGDGGEEERGRRVRGLEDLLKLCLNEGSEEPMGTGTGTLQGNPTQEDQRERAAWLNSVINAFTVDVVEEVLEATAILKREVSILHRWETLSEQCPTEKNCIKRIEEATDILVARVGNLDIATDFEKIGGFSVFPLMLGSKHEKLNIKGAELLGEVVQNHPTCQKAGLSQNLMEILINILKSNDKTDEVKLKTLYGMSCLIRGNSDSLKDFVKFDGFSGILCAMQTEDVGEIGLKLRTKAAFLLTSILSEKDERFRFNKILLDMGFVEQFIGLLQREHDRSHEHILSALLNFISEYPPALKACLKPQLEFEQMLRDRLEFVEGKPEFLEEEGYCQSILKLIHRPSADDNLTER